MRHILVLTLTLQLSGCGFIANMRNLVKSNTTTYIFGDPFLDNIVIEQAKIFIRVVDLSCLGEKMQVQFKQDLIQKLKDAGYVVVKSLKQADLVVSLVFKNFSVISKQTLANLKKYIHYKDTIGIIKTDQGADGVNNFSITDGDLSVSKQGGGFFRSAGFWGKIFKTDFTSGFAIGSLAAFLIAGSNPITLVLGAVVGGVITSILQIVTKSTNYSGTIAVRISRKSDSSHVGRGKSLTTADNNVIQAAYVEDGYNWLDYHSDLLVTVEASSSKAQARKKIRTESLQAISSMLIG